MRTTRIILNYNVTQDDIVPPSERDLARKNVWLENVKKSVEADWKPLIVRVTYEMFDPEIQNMRRFFEGPCVLYYAVQNSDMFAGYPDANTLKKYREEILDEMLGYDFHTVNRVIRRRKSTTDFKSISAFSNFLQQLEETIFDPAGYEFPDSKHFWELVKEHGYEEAKAIVVRQLQRRLAARVDNPLQVS